ncbi:probable G-protein coupled receptor 132 [Sorex araneus]|uniref:probable G-protein coupled receptor 132 n=1 Tax=Sorex araneus TaxID=42254 RepID=UPI00033193B5|nr:probable G-protein coupled receptor 132 [Sorex araneus]
MPVLVLVLMSVSALVLVLMLVLLPVPVLVSVPELCWCQCRTLCQSFNLTHACANATTDSWFKESRVFLVALYSAVCALALPANGLTAWLALRRARRGNVLAVYLFCLALCELLYAGTLPLWVRYIQNWHRWPFGPWACRLTAFVFFCNIYVSVLLLCCISCDRFLALAWPLRSRGYRRPATAAGVSAAVFGVVAAAHSPAFYLSHNSNGLDYGNATCFEALPVTRTAAAFYGARFVLGFALPLAVLTFTSLRVARSVARSPGLPAARKARARRLLLAVLLVFLACFAPYHLVLLLRAAAFSHLQPSELCPLEWNVYTASVVCLSLCTLSSVADPVIYLLATGRCRHAARLHRRRREARGGRAVGSTCSPTAPVPGALSPGPTQPPTLGQELC